MRAWSGWRRRWRRGRVRRPVGRRVRRPVGRRGGRLELRGHGVELRLRRCELEFELCHVDALGFRREDLPPQELVVLLQERVGAPQAVALLHDLRERLARRGQRLRRRREARLEGRYPASKDLLDTGLARRHVISLRDGSTSVDPICMMHDV